MECEGERYCGWSVRARGTVDGMRGREVLWMEREDERYCGRNVRARGTVDGM